MSNNFNISHNCLTYFANQYLNDSKVNTYYIGHEVLFTMKVAT